MWACCADNDCGTGSRSAGRWLERILGRECRFTNITFSGGVFNQLDNLDNRQFGDEELAVMEEAERVGRFVAARVHGKKGMVAALKAGC